MNVGHWVEKWSRLAPDKIAIIDDDQGFTYKDINEQSNRLANFLLGKGIRKGDRVGVLLFNCHQFIEIYVALGKMGAIFVPLNWRMPPPELESIINDAEARLIIFHADFEEVAQFLKKHLALPNMLFLALPSREAGDPDFPWAMRYAETDRYPATEPALEDPPEPEDPHLLLYSSGTTGTPKGVLLSHRKTFYNVLNADMFYRLTPGDLFLVHRPLFHSGGLLVDSTPVIYKGGTLIYKRRFSPKEFVDTIQRYKVTHLEPAAALLTSIAAEYDVAKVFGSIKTAYTGGERIPEALLKYCHARGLALSQIFGMTETSIVAWLPVDDAVRKVGSVGKPVFHGEVRIINAEMKDVTAGEVGEVIVKGPILMSGYWKKPELTNEVVRDGWFHTGDLARMDDEGFIYVVGRKKDMFISGGENVYPAEVEKALLAHPKVVDVAVCGVPDDRWGEVGKAWLVLKEQETLSFDEVFTFLQNRIAKYKIPKHIEFVGTLPRTSTGKIQKYLLTTRDPTQWSGAHSNTV